MDMSEKDIAAVLEIGTGSVKKHTSRAMAKLAATLGSEDD
jgi:DNA-directed RNA polymerase specialized sigma24 family protein